MTLFALYIEVLLRFVHLVSAIIIVGGLLFERAVFFPYADTQGEKFIEVRRYARRHYRIPLWFALAGAALSGGVLWYRLLPVADARLNQVLALKAAMFLASLVLVLLLTLRLRPLKNIRHKAPFMLTVVVILGFFLTFLGSYAAGHAKAARVRRAQEEAAATPR